MMANSHHPTHLGPLKWLQHRVQYQKGVLFIRDAQEGEGPTVRAGMGACALEGSETKPSLVGPRGQPSSAGCQESQRPRTSLTLP